MSRAARIFSTIAEGQHGAVARRQGEAQGVSRGEADHAVDAGALITVAPGVYRVPGAPQTVTMAVAAAALAADGHTSSVTSARMLRLELPLRTVPLHTTVTGGSAHPRVTRVDVAAADHAFFAVKLHRHRDHGEPVVVIDGIPCSDAARTLIDIAPLVELDTLRDAFDRARDLGLVSIDALAHRFAMLGGRGRPGTPKVRTVLEQAPPRPLQSKLERIAERMLTGSRLPQPVRQLPLGKYRLDFAWPALMAAFETEGFEWHGHAGPLEAGPDPRRAPRTGRLASDRRVVGRRRPATGRDGRTDRAHARRASRARQDRRALLLHCPLTRAGRGQRTMDDAEGQSSEMRRA